MSEQLEVKNFLGVKHINFTVAPFTIIIGPNASGKSTIAKILYFARNIFTHVSNSYFIDMRKPGLPDESEIKSQLKDQFRRLFPKAIFDQSNFEIRYTSGRTSISIKAYDGNFAITLPDEMLRSIGEIFIKAKTISKAEIEESTAILASWAIRKRWKARRDLKAYYKSIDVNDNNQIFVPALRSIFASLKNKIFTLLVTNAHFGTSAAFDPLIADFGSFLESAKENSRNHLEEHDTCDEESMTDLRLSYINARKMRIEADQDLSIYHHRSKQLIHKIIKGNYVHKGDDDFIRHENGDLIPIENCSSGQQESLPLALALCCDSLSRAPTSLYIEEPEAHLYPTSQRDVSQLIALAFNKIKPQIFITTHSPYILTSINNLIEAGRLYESDLSEENRKKLELIIPHELALSPRKVKAYLLSEDGIDSIMDDETGLINAYAIDQVSTKIAVEFDQMFDIDNP